MGWSSRTPYAKRENGIVAIGVDELLDMAIIFGYTKDDLGIFLNKTLSKRTVSNLVRKSYERKYLYK